MYKKPYTTDLTDYYAWRILDADGHEVLSVEFGHMLDDNEHPLVVEAHAVHERECKWICAALNQYKVKL